jgi:hypothetical protein
MKLKTFNRADFPECDFSCGTVAVSLITGEPVYKVQWRLGKLRKSKNWPKKKIYAWRKYMTWDEALSLTKNFGRKRKTVWLKNRPILKSVDKFKRGTYLVFTTEHLQVIKNGVIFDAYYDNCLHGEPIEWHEANRRKTWGYKRLDKGK